MTAPAEQIAPAFPDDLSWEQFLALPLETRNAALIEGRVVVNPPGPLHELIIHRLWQAFSDWASETPGRGEVSTQQAVRAAERRGYQPDFAWWPADRCAPPGHPPAFTGLPSIIVEVLSPSTRRFDVVRKRNDYDTMGVPELWLIDPDGPAALLHRRSSPGSPYDVVADLIADDQITSSVLPGFSVRVASLVER